MKPPSPFNACVWAGCAYECVAIPVRRVPTVSRLCWRYPPLGWVVLAILADHLLRKGNVT